MADDGLPEIKAVKRPVPFDAKIWLSLEAAPSG